MTTLRRSLLFVPGNNPGMLVNSPVFGSDSVIFDLEDAVSPAEKDTARLLVKNALETINYGDIEIVVRVNGNDTPFWKEDLKTILPQNPDCIMPPKIQCKDDVEQFDEYISKIEEKEGLSKGGVKLIPLIETALGVENAYEIASASDRVVAIFLGAEDLTANLGAKRTKAGEEIFYSRSRIVVAAKAAQVAALDTPFTDVDDEEGLIKDATFAKDLGFDGKTVISPRHIDNVNKVFTPSEEEIQYAKRVIEAIKQGKAEGKGVISLDGEMIDAPIVARAEKTMEMAKASSKGVIL